MPMPAFHDVLYKFPPDLTIKDKNNWTYTGQFHQNYSKFAPALNATEYRWYTRLVREFVQRWEDFNITLMLKDATVHGACMYYGFVPWDGDVAVHVLHSHRRRLQSALKFSHTHILRQYKNFQWTVWNKNESTNTRKRWNWPYINIFFSKRKIHKYMAIRMELRNGFTLKATSSPFRLAYSKICSFLFRTI